VINNKKSLLNTNIAEYRYANILDFQTIFTLGNKK